MRKTIIAGKPVVFLSNSKNVPSRKLINSVYSKIPDDTNIPLVFMTKKQYVDQYVKNQEKKKGQFPHTLVKQYEKNELNNMGGVVSRYTTNHNPYMTRKTIFFTDNKISNKQFRESAQHEYAHELWERNPKVRRDWKSVNKANSPTAYGKTDRQEDFAESYMQFKTGRLQDPQRKRILTNYSGKLGNDKLSKNDVGTEWGVAPQTNILDKSYNPMITGQQRTFQLNTNDKLHNNIFRMLGRDNSKNRQTSTQNNDTHTIINNITSGYETRENQAAEQLNKNIGMSEYFKKLRGDNDK